MESTTSNARYAVRNSDGGEGGATKESTTSNALYAFGDSDGGQGGASIESTISNALYWFVKSDNTLTIFVFIANNISAEDVCSVWINYSI